MHVELLLNGNCLYSGDLNDFQQPVLIGRSTSCPWRTPPEATKLSSRHARILREGKTLVLEDLQSTNGTFDAKGQPVTRAILKPGLEFRLGECVLIVSRGQPQLVSPAVIIEMGPFEGTRFPITTDLMVIGSGEDAHVRINDTIVSSHHAQLAFAPDGKITLTDLDSTNGTLIGSKPLAPHTPTPLKPGSLFFIAHHGLVVRRTGKTAPSIPLWMIAAGGVLAVVIVALFLVLTRPDKSPKDPSPDPAVANKTKPDPAKTTSASISWPPDWKALDTQPGIDSESVALLAGFWDEYLTIGKALIADPNQPDIALRLTKVRSSISAVKVSPPLDAYAAKMISVIELAEQAAKAWNGLPALAPALEIWASPQTVAQILTVDTLSSAYPSNTTTPSGQYDAWLGFRGTFKKLFERSGRLVLTPLADDPYSPLATELAQRHARIHDVVSWLDASGIPLERDRKLLRESFAEQLAARLTLVKKLSALADAPGRDAFIAAVLAERLLLPSDPPQRVQGVPLPTFITNRFIDLLDQVNTLDTALDREPSRADALTKQILATGIPGDRAVDNVWKGRSAL